MARVNDFKRAILIYANEVSSPWDHQVIGRRDLDFLSIDAQGNRPVDCGELSPQFIHCHERSRYIRCKESSGFIISYRRLG